MTSSQILFVIAIVLPLSTILVGFLIKHYRKEGIITRKEEQLVFVFFLLISSISFIYGILAEAIQQVIVLHGFLIIFYLFLIIKGVKVEEEK